MSSRFEFTGKDRQIFIEALKDYSDNCVPPTLTPGCPFFEITVTGPSCGEQCHDLLAAHGSDRESTSALNLGFGLFAHERRPRRSRRGPEPSSRPYDAQRLYLRDRERPTDSRHTVSLLIELETRLKTPPWFADDLEERQYLIRAAFTELVRRGFSADDLLAALSRRVTTVMVAFMAATLVIETVTPKEEQAGLPQIGTEWINARKLFHVDTDGTTERKMLGAITAATSLLDAAVRWASSLSLEELTAWPAFSKEALEGEFRALPGSADRGDWIFDRFTETYPTEWRTSSLYLEWKYIYSQSTGCAPRDQMELRRVDAEVIGREIANRTVARDDGVESACRQSVQPSEFTPIAVDYLKSGRHEAAAALFEALAQLSPDDAVLLNNHGFCLIPIDRDRALEALTHAADIAAKPAPVNYANRILLLYLAGRTDEALALAEESRGLDTDTHAWLWELDEGGELSLGEDVNTQEYIDSLVAHIKRTQAVGY